MGVNLGLSHPKVSLRRIFGIRREVTGVRGK
jgi:hypothetical protein